MSRKRKKLQKRQIKNMLIVLIIAICLFIIYKFNFTTKSEVEVTTPVAFKEFGTETILNSDIPLEQDEDGEYYIVLPEKVNGVFATKYFINSDNSAKTQTLDTNTTQDETVNENQNSSNTNNVINENTVSTSNTITNSIVENTVTNTTVEENQVENQSDNKNEEQEYMSLFDSVVNTYSSNLESTSDEVTTTTENTITETSTENTDNSTKVDNSTKSETIENTTNVTEVNANKVENNTIVENTSEVEENKNQEESKAENTEVVNNEVNSEETTNTVQNQTTEESDNVTTSLPGEKYYLSQEEVENGTTTITVEFQTVEINGLKLYNQELTADMVESQINLVCYIPLGYYLDVTKEDTENIQDLKADVEEIANSTTLFAYDITITDGTNEYQPQDYYQVAKVTITAEENFTDGDTSSSLEVLHIVEDEEKDEINFQKITISNKEDNSLEFATNEFSVYAVILYDSIQPTYVIVDNYEKEKYYLLGKNYTDDISGENSNTYKEEDLVKVNVEYYSYDPSDDLSSNNEITLSGSNVSLTKGTYSTSEYYYDITVNVSANSKKDIDSSKNWTMTLDVGNTFNLDSTRNYSGNSGKYSNIVYDSTAQKITLSGENWDAWSCTDLKTYSYTFRIYYNTGTTNANATISISQVTAIERHLVGYVGPESPADGSDSERQQLFKYTLCVQKDSSGNVSFEAIDNPYMDRPAGYGFNGWLSTESTVSITTDSYTFVQTISANTNGSNEITIKLYVDWQEANEVFLNTSSGLDTNTGTFNKPVKTFSKASTILKNNYKTSPAKTVSDRELNIIILINGTVSNLTSIGKAYTYTSLYDGKDYRSSTTYVSLSISSTNTSKLELDADLQLYYLNIVNSANNYYTGSDHNINSSNILYYVRGNSFNLRIGRGMMPLSANVNSLTDKTVTFSQVQGGGKSDKKYKTVIESGKYNNVQALVPTGGGTYNINSILVLGNDYDREKNNNNNLKVFYRTVTKTTGNVTPKDSNKPIFYMNVKSGSFGTDYCNKNITNSSTYPYTYWSGIYVGGPSGSSYSDQSGNRILKVEGGNISNVMGGMSLTTTNVNNVKTYIYMTGGTIGNIFGGAGTSDTYGNKIIQVTGGNVTYCVFGGSNGYQSSSSASGKLNGSSLVYIGGNAKIGIENDSTSECYGAINGSVYGSGNGNESYSGYVYSSKVIINDNAQILNSVYGGGNYGAVTPSSSTTVDVTTGITNFIDKSTSIESNEKYIIADGINAANSMVVNSTGNELTNSTSLTSSSPTDNQYWILEENDDGKGTIKYAIKNAVTNKYLKVTAASNTKVNISFTTSPESYFTYTANKHKLSTILRYNNRNRTYDFGYSSGSWNATSDTNNTNEVYFLEFNRNGL